MPVRREIDRTPKKFQRAIIKKIEILSKAVKLITLRPEEPFDWLPGQFIITQCIINNEQRKADYTITSSNSNINEFDIAVENYEGSTVGKYYHTLLIGDIITIKGPHGRFYFEDTEKNLVFVSRNIGIVATLAILQNLIEIGFKKQITYLNIVTNNFDEIFITKIKKMSKFLNLTYLKVSPGDISEEKLNSGKFMKSDLELLLSNSKTSVYYLSGSSVFLKSFRQKLIGFGVDKNSIWREMFG